MPLAAEELARRVRFAIESTGMTQESAAKAIGMDPSALSKALAGKRNFSSLEIAQLCETLNVAPMALLGDGTPSVRSLAAEGVALVRQRAELDALLTDVGYPPGREHRYPATLLDRAIEAWLAGHISIRPVAGLIGVDADDLLAALPSSPQWPRTPQPATKQETAPSEGGGKAG